MSRERRPYSVEFTKKQKRETRLAQENRCAVCGEEDSLEVHHCTPVAHGGNRDSERIGLCPPCHKCMDRVALNAHERGNKVTMLMNVWYLLGKQGKL